MAVKQEPGVAVVLGANRGIGLQVRASVFLQTFDIYCLEERAPQTVLSLGGGILVGKRCMHAPSAVPFTVLCRSQVTCYLL